MPSSPAALATIEAPRLLVGDIGAATGAGHTVIAVAPAGIRAPAVCILAGAMGGGEPHRALTTIGGAGDELGVGPCLPWL